MEISASQSFLLRAASSQNVATLARFVTRDRRRARHSRGSTGCDGRERLAPPPRAPWSSSRASRCACACARARHWEQPAFLSMRCWPSRSRAAATHVMPALRRALFTRRARPCVRALCWQTALGTRKTRSTSMRASTCSRSSARGAACRSPGPTRGGDVRDVSRRASSVGGHGLPRCVMPSLDGLSDGHFDVCLHGAHDRDVVRTACVSVYGLSTSGGSMWDRW